MASAYAFPTRAGRQVIPMLGQRLRSLLPPLLYGVRLWVAVCLALFVAFRLELENPSWAGASAAIVCQPVLGASLRKGWFRLVGTVIGAIAAGRAERLFPTEPRRLPVRPRAVGRRLRAGRDAAAQTSPPMPPRSPDTPRRSSSATSLARWAASVAMPSTSPSLAGAEICIGIVCAGLVLATTDLGGATPAARDRC